MIKILIVEDSYFLGFMLRKILSSDPHIEVVGRADSFDESIEKVDILEPDVIILDIEMPGISGLDILHEIMTENPTPVIVIGTRSELGRKEIISAFSYGALDFIIRPDDPNRIDEISDELITLVKVAASVEIRKLIFRKKKKVLKAPKVSDKVIAFGASSGGPPVLASILSSFPENFPAAVIVIQHMPKGFTKEFAERLNSLCAIGVEEARDGTRIEPNRALVAPGGYNLEVQPRGKNIYIRLNKKDSKIKPSVDIAFESLARVYDGNLIAVVLTGIGDDGSRGVEFVKKNDGRVIVQDESTSLVFGMPKRVIESGNADLSYH